MKKFSILALAAGMLSMALAIPSHATNFTNGIALNGIALNGIALNGIALNGTNLNDLTQKGERLNDKNLDSRQTRQAMQGIALHRVKISMPR
jgi:hypothetical protein